MMNFIDDEDFLDDFDNDDDAFFSSANSPTGGTTGEERRDKDATSDDNPPDGSVGGVGGGGRSKGLGSSASSSTFGMVALTYDDVVHRSSLSTRPRCGGAAGDGAVPRSRKTTTWSCWTSNGVTCQTYAIRIRHTAPSRMRYSSSTSWHTPPPVATGTTIEQLHIREGGGRCMSSRR